MVGSSIASSMSTSRSFGGDEFTPCLRDLPGDTLASFTETPYLEVVHLSRVAQSCYTTPIFGKIRCDIDNRISSNSGGLITSVGAVDPDIKPFRNSELTFTFEVNCLRILLSARIAQEG